MTSNFKPQTSNNLLTVSDVSKIAETNFILKDISFSQKRNQKTAVVGETGSGKSTLLKIIAGLVQADRGEVRFEQSIIAGPHHTLVPGHPGISYLSQHYQLPHSLRVEQVLRYANTLEEASELYSVCRISHLLERRTDELSGGERQRIALAMSIISSPKLLLLDEPFSNLDTTHKNILKSVIHDIGHKLKITCIMVSHDPADILSWADKILILKDGALVQKGTPENVYKAPVNEYVAGLFGSYTLLSIDQFNAFATASPIMGTRKKLIFRPEDFNVSTKKHPALKGKVTHVTYYGSYYEVHVALPEFDIIAKSETGGWRIYDDVYVSLV